MWPIRLAVPAEPTSGVWPKPIQAYVSVAPAASAYSWRGPQPDLLDQEIPRARAATATARDAATPHRLGWSTSQKPLVSTSAAAPARTGRGAPRVDRPGAGGRMRNAAATSRTTTAAVPASRGQGAMKWESS
ncbi:hypothetical protein GTY65_06515 [Streptomyces sp. SID8379]|uniref:hypothetical protein n=1 Tax=unclassified Streptomyces TaxID=2593676 RepID=UPI001319F397|nr:MULTISPECIES: hypothetical protein [unclassified Streptomyces]MYW63733.1 hypothetical protein [Streptomyces sp. SID8379]